MEAHTLGQALKLIMKQHGWTQADLAREFDVSQPWVSQVIKGVRDTKIKKAAALLASVGWELRITPKTKEGPVKRRTFMAKTASAGPAILLGSLEASPYQDPTYVTGLAERLSGDMYEHGGISLAAVANRHVEKLEPAMGSRDPRLQKAASQLACEAIWVLYDANRFGSAERAGRVALALAKSTDDFETQSRVFSALTQVSIARGQADRGVMYAQRGLKLPAISDTQRTWLSMRLGRSLALVRGQERAAYHTIQDAHNFERLTSFEKADMAGCVGAALTDLRVYPQALASFDLATQLTGRLSPLLYANTMGHQIRTALRASQPSMAAHWIPHLARVVPLVASSRLDRHVAKIVDQSARWSAMPIMRDAREQLIDVQTKPR